MCASYGLDPRFTDAGLVAEADADVIEGLRAWAEQNAGETLRPTGKNLRNLNPLLVPEGDTVALEPSWWGYLVNGEPAKFPSINTRSERLQERPAGLKRRAIVPATEWFEMQKPAHVWHEFALEDQALFGMAAVTQRVLTPQGEWITCYSIVMAPATDHLKEFHDRMPVLIPPHLTQEWLTAPPTRDLLDEAVLASGELAERVTVSARP